MKRAWLASAVASVLFATGMAAIGSATVDEVSDVPYPGPGASAVYSVTPVGSGNDYGVQRLVMNWRNVEEVHDEEFNLRLAWPVDIAIEGTDWDFRLWAYYDAETGEPILDGQESARTFETGPVVIGSNMCTWYVANEHPCTAQATYDLAFDLYHEMRGLCGLTAGPTLDPKADEVDLHGHCSRLNGRGITSMERVGHLEYENPNDPRFKVEYVPGVPFPVKTTVPLSDMLLYMPHTDVVWQMELESWEGAYPYTPTPSLVQSNGVPSQNAWTDWGIDDSDLDHPFRLSEAYAAAVADLEEPTVSGFLDDHPDAFLRSAWSFRQEDGSGNHAYYWALTWTDGDQWISKLVSQRTGGALGITHEELPPSIEVADHTPSDIEWTDLPTPEAVPATLPDLQELLARHADMRLLEDDQNRYGFQIYCSNGCEDPFIFMAAGTFTSQSTDAAQDPQAATRGATDGAVHAYDQLMVYQDGTAVYTERASYRTGSIVPPTNGAGTDSTDDGSAAAWVPPSAQATAGVGLVAAAGGLLIYLAPGLKAPALALFSRIRGEHLLEHPGRSAIMAMVEADPGIHFKELMRRLDMGRATLDHHLQKLTEARLLKVHVSPGYTCYFPRKVDRALMAASPFLRSPGPKAILEEVVHGDGSTVAAISKKVGLSTSTVSHHLQRMKDAGLVEGGGRGGFQPSTLAMRAI